MDTKKLIRIGYYAVIFIVLIIAVVILLTADDEDTAVNMALKFGAVLMVIAAIGAIGTFVYNVALNFRESKGLVIGVVALLVIFGIGYSMANPDLLSSITDVDPTAADRSLSKMTGAGLKSTVIIGALTVLASIYFGVKNIFN
jgi:cytochrome bd-type quinol oxidase subunit 2